MYVCVHACMCMIGHVSFCAHANGGQGSRSPFFSVCSLSYFVFQDRALLYSPGWLGTHHVNQLASNSQREHFYWSFKTHIKYLFLIQAVRGKSPLALSPPPRLPFESGWGEMTQLGLPVRLGEGGFEH